MVNTSTISFAKPQQKLSSADWHGIWLKKLEQACAADDLKEKTNHAEEIFAESIAAAIQFFYLNVLKFRMPVDTLSGGSGEPATNGMIFAFVFLRYNRLEALTLREF